MSESIRPLMPVAVVFVLLLGVLWWMFDGYIAQRTQPNRAIAQATGEGATVRLVRSRDGHYRAPGSINGDSVDFLVDTGASVIAIPASVAERIGLSRGSRISVQTAAGPSRAYRTRLERVIVGSIAIDDVRAAIVPAMGGDQVLLGMSFLSHLEMQFRDGELLLR